VTLRLTRLLSLFIYYKTRVGTSTRMSVRRIVTCKAPKTECTRFTVSISEIDNNQSLNTKSLHGESTEVHRAVHHFPCSFPYGCSARNTKEATNSIMNCLVLSRFLIIIVIVVWFRAAHADGTRTATNARAHVARTYVYVAVLRL